MHSLATEIESQFSADRKTALATDQEAMWLELLTDAWSCSAEHERARTFAARRLMLLRDSAPDAVVARQLLDEAATLVADERWDLAEWCCSSAARLGPEPANLFRMVLIRGRIVEARDGAECAIEYYEQVCDHHLEGLPDLAYESMIRIADVYFRSGDITSSILFLASVEERFGGEPVEERARHMRRGLLELLLEQSTAPTPKDVQPNAAGASGPRRPGYRAAPVKRSESRP